jgi:site-specific recombinase XerD
MAGRLRIVAAILGYGDPKAVPWRELRYEHVAAIRAKLEEQGKAPATINATLSALRGVASAAFNLGQISAENYQRLRSIKPVRGDRLPAGRALSAGELSALMGACATDSGPAGVRDAALIGVLYCAGLRRAEIAALDVSDCTMDEGAAELKVRGKGNKERIAYLDNGARDALEDWLQLRGELPGPLFVPINKGGRVLHQQLSEQAVYNTLRKRAKQAGVKEPSPHDLRRSFISDLLDAGADIATVQKLAGHSQVTTTAKYDRRGEHAKRRAVKLLHVPYQRQS